MNTKHSQVTARARAHRGWQRNSLAWLFCAAGSLGSAHADWFDDVSVSAGVDHQDNSFGVAWGDVNGDGYPDIFSSNHWHVPSLYLNQRDGTFIDVQSAHDVAMGHVDVHGCTWADYDNDGDQDLIAAVGGFTSSGGTPDTPYFDNIDGTLVIGDPQASGLNYAYSSRSPVWLDENADGLLDMLMVARPKLAGFYTALLRQVSPGMFENVTAAAGLDGQLAASGYLLIGPNSPQRPDILLNRGTYYQWNGTQWNNTASSVFGATGAMVDASHADVNGDGLLDLYVVREGIRSQVATDERSVRVAYRSVSNVPGEIDFAGGALEVVRSLNLSVNAFRLGADQQTVTLADSEDPIVLDPSDPQVQGEPAFVLTSALRVFIWFTPEDGRWHFRIGRSGSAQLVELEINADDPIADLTIDGIDADDTPLDNKLFINNGDGTYSQDNTSILRLGPTRSAIMADLDNDMDIDAYIVNRNAVTNLPNQLFENLGDGTFVEVPDGGGAAGPVEGNGDSVAFADYDLDGFLDLSVVNGRSDLIMPMYPGPHRLFRNRGNDNNWIQIDLEGTNSNREAIGTVVELTTGAVTQTRLQDGGVHGFAQNFRRVHFGLANHELIDRIVVRWPSGVVQELTRVPVNQIIQVIEPEPELMPGVPATLAGGADGVYLWKDTFDGPYHLRAIHDDPASETRVTFLASQPLVTTELHPAAGQVDWQSHDYGFDFVTNESTEADGVDFELHSAARGLYSVQTGPTINPRQVTLGSGLARPTPAGWLLASAGMPLRPAFSTGDELGLFVGRGVAGDRLEMRWNGDGRRHEGTVELFAAQPWFLQFFEDDLEGRDTWFSGASYARAYGAVANAWDGTYVRLLDDTRLGLLYTQDDLFQPGAVNRRDAGGELGVPNAYRLPKPSPWGPPQYNLVTDAQIFVWRDTADRWRLRATAGGSNSHYVGRIIADRAPLFVAPRNLESNDLLDTSDPLVVHFDFRAGRGYFDGLDMRYPPGTRIRIHVDESNGDVLDALRIGAGKWPVSRLPVILNADAEATEPPARERATGQTVVFAAGDDGDLRKGVASPTPRFEARADGTVYDFLTGLTWLRNADCFGQQDWSSALAAAATLADSQCGLNDGSVPGDWRLANVKEQLSLIDSGRTFPALPPAHPFDQVQNAFYWSSTTTDDNAGRAWGTQFTGGNVERRRKDTSQHPVTGNPHYVWPVKGP